MDYHCPPSRVDDRQPWPPRRYVSPVERAVKSASPVGRLRADFHAHGTPVRLSRGDAVYTLGQPGGHLYMIESGWVKVQGLSEVGKSCVLGIYGAEDIIGESCLIERECTATATAMSPTVLRKLPRHQFLAVLGAEQVREDWLRYQVRRMLEHQQAMTLLATVDSEHRLAAVLLHLADKLGVRTGDAAVLGYKLTQEEFAEMVGTTRSRIGFFMKRFRQQGLIEVGRGSRLLVHEPRLRRYIAEREAS